MTSLLDNELVRKYFYWDGIDCDGAARRILEAMQQPIKSGESYLYVDSDGTVTERTLNYGAVDWAVHTPCLRLPDRFQKRESCKSHWCEGCNQYLAHKYDPKPTPESEKCECPGHPYCNACQGDGRAGHCLPKDEVEEKISHLAEEFRCHAQMREQPGWFRTELRELVALARKS